MARGSHLQVRRIQPGSATSTRFNLFSSVYFYLGVFGYVFSKFFDRRFSHYPSAARDQAIDRRGLMLRSEMCVPHDHLERPVPEQLCNRPQIHTGHNKSTGDHHANSISHTSARLPQKQKPRGRLWLNDGSCVWLRPERNNHVWSYDFVSAKMLDGRTERMPNLIDEHTRERLMIGCERSWSSARVVAALADVMVMKEVPEHLRSRNGPEFVARDLRKWLASTGAQTLYIEPGSPRENGYCESFNSKLRDEFLNGEIFYSLKELRVLAERWRAHYDTVRPHSSLGYRAPAPAAWLTEVSKGMEKWKAKNDSHFPTPPTTAAG